MAVSPLSERTYVPTPVEMTYEDLAEVVHALTINVRVMAVKVDMNDRPGLKYEFAQAVARLTAAGELVVELERLHRHQLSRDAAP